MVKNGVLVVSAIMLKGMVSMAMESKDGGVALASALLAEEIRNAIKRSSLV
jgi:hypothetical protein